MNNKYLNIYILIIIALMLVLFVYKQNNDIKVNNISYTNNRIPESFDNYNIIQISDLHNKQFGKGHFKILKKIEMLEPNIILITGDIIDRRRYNLDVALEFVKGAKKIAPVYYVPGNHEAWSFKYLEISEALTAAGVTVLNNQQVEISKNNQVINIMGLMDAAFDTDENYDYLNLEKFKENLAKFSFPKNFSVLLSHRPEIFNLYVNSEIDLVFSGHAHGGQFRLPFIGSLFAPNQGFFPKYTQGMYTEKKTSMVVSRGLGNSLIPLRLFNKPEIVKVTLRSSHK